METKKCPICDGSSLSVPKAVREGWRDRYFNAEKKAQDGVIPRGVFDEVSEAIQKEMDGCNPCAFCREGMVPVTDRDRQKDSGKPGLDEGEQWKG